MLGRFGVGPPSERDDVVRISLDSGLIARESFWFYGSEKKPPG